FGAKRVNHLFSYTFFSCYLGDLCVCTGLNPGGACMLDFMRRQRSALKWVWVILIFIFSVTLVTLYSPFGDLPNVSITNDVASIGQESISAQEFQTAYRNSVDRMRGQLNPEMLRAFRFDRQIMEALVARHVMTEEAKRLGLNASPSEIEQKILENP